MKLSANQMGNYLIRLHQAIAERGDQDLNDVLKLVQSPIDHRFHHPTFDVPHLTLVAKNNERIPTLSVGIATDDLIEFCFPLGESTANILNAAVALITAGQTGITFIDFQELGFFGTPIKRVKVPVRLSFNLQRDVEMFFTVLNDIDLIAIDGVIMMPETLRIGLKREEDGQIYSSLYPTPECVVQRHSEVIRVKEAKEEAKEEVHVPV